MIRRTALVLLGLLALAGGGAAAVRAADTGLRASKLPVKRDIVAVIEGQLAAFRAGDVAKAYGFAAATLRVQMTQRAFGEIVRRSYPEIWASTRAEFGLVRDDGERARLLVHVFAKASHAAYEFTLVQERAGWRIDGVRRHDPGKGEKV